eukprot:SAG31_NODE_5167_length_2703_cov_3.435100_2_plen_124_part_00
MDFHREQLVAEDDSEGERQCWQAQARRKRDERQRAVWEDAGFVGRVVANVQRRAAQICRSAFWASMREALRAALSGQEADGDGHRLCRPQELVCYGLGELDDLSGEHQLALLTLLKVIPIDLN